MNMGGDPKVKLAFFIDMHAHTTAVNGFMYTNSEVGDAQGGEDLYPKLLDSICPDFVYDKCKSNSKSEKAGTGRRAMGDFLSVCGTYCYTLEVSFWCSLLESGAHGAPYTETTYQDIGSSVALAFVGSLGLVSELKKYQASANYSNPRTALWDPPKRPAPAPEAPPESPVPGKKA
jgi:hypothetical protein